jgi:hypothetical protein
MILIVAKVRLIGSAPELLHRWWRLVVDDSEKEDIFMKLPDEILSNLNRSLSRHQHPENLDWQMVRGSWTAMEEGRTFVVVDGGKIGYVIAEQRNVKYELHWG